MPAKSKAQRRAFGMAKAMQEGDIPMTPGSPAGQIAMSAGPETIDEFARTPEANLPKRVSQKGKSKKKLRRIGYRKNTRRSE